MSLSDGFNLWLGKLLLGLAVVAAFAVIWAVVMAVMIVRHRIKHGCWGVFGR